MIKLSESNLESKLIKLSALIGFSDDEDAFFNEKDLDVPEDPNFRKSIEEMTLMPDILTIETSTARKIKATNSLPRAPTRLRTPLSPTSVRQSYSFPN